METRDVQSTSVEGDKPAGPWLMNHYQPIAIGHVLGNRGDLHEMQKKIEAALGQPVEIVPGAQNRVFGVHAVAATAEHATT